MRTLQQLHKCPQDSVVLGVLQVHVANIGTVAWRGRMEWECDISGCTAGTRSQHRYRGLQVAWHKNRDEISACAKFGGNFELKFCACADFVVIFVPSNLQSSVRWPGGENGMGMEHFWVYCRYT